MREVIPEAELGSKRERMHVCLSYMYVCFESETSEHVCMFQAAERVCLSH